MKDFIFEYWQFVRENRKYWLIPLMTILAVTGFFIVFAQGNAVAPFIYTLF